MAAKKLPYFPFYTGDWVKDTRILSLEARAVWVDLLCLMHDSVRRGFLIRPTGEAFSDEQLSVYCGCPSETLRRAVQELLTSGVCSSSQTGIYFCRHMVERERRRVQASQYGSKGGNPALKGRDKGWVKGVVNHELTYDTDSSSTNQNQDLVAGKEGVVDPGGAGGKVNPALKAKEIVGHYQAVVRPKYGKARGEKNVTALLRKGRSPEALLRAADGYAAECAAQATDPKFRFAVGNFYGKGGAFEEYLDWNPTEKNGSTPGTTASPYLAE